MVKDNEMKDCPLGCDEAGECLKAIEGNPSYCQRPLPQGPLPTPKRYTIDKHFYPRLKPSDTGEYVLYADHVAAIDAQARQIEELIDQLAAKDVDGDRYRYLRQKVSGWRVNGEGPMRFKFPDIDPLDDISRGSIAQHLDKAIDEKMEDE